MKKIIIFLISYVVTFGIVALVAGLASSAGEGIAIVFLTVLTIFGWRFINFITPSYFIWLPLAGWVIYIIVKCIVSAFLGIFIIPYHVAKMIIERWS
ncbi:MAG: hypothetical protein J6B74_03715 [Ruminococcus sp.]|nr:hypothetical protein [Ruminococcus sp.]